jgi:TonB family protein
VAARPFGLSEMVNVSPPVSARGAETRRVTHAARRASIADQQGEAAPQTPTPQPIPAGQFGAGAYRPGPGVASPVRLREVRPQYTPQAMREKIQGSIELEVVIGPDGAVSDARVVRSLDAVFGLDEQALKAVRATPFKAAEVAGRPVASLVTFELAFRLDGTPASAAKAFGDGAYRLETPPTGLVAPARLEAIRPQDTPEALRQKIQGPVAIEAIVGADGVVEDARVVTSLDSTFGLDAQALDAVRRTPFRPATLNGTPVRCVVTFDLTFTLR